MRILFVNEKCGYFGGVEQNIADTAKGLAERGHECLLLHGEETAKDAQGYRSIFRECRAFDPLLEPVPHLGGGFDRVVAELAPDVVYVHKVMRFDPPEGLLDRVPFVRMVHDHDLCCPRRHKYTVWTGRVCRCGAGLRCWADLAFLARSQCSRWKPAWVDIGSKLEEIERNRRIGLLLVGSRFMKEELLQNGFDEARVRIVPPVIRSPVEEPEPLTEDRRVLYVGQLIRGKGVDLLLRSLATLRTPFEASIVGDGNARGKLEALSAKLGLGARVRFEGWFGNEELGRLYSGARVVVVPSRWPEPFGMVGLEAMSRARAVVAFRVGGIPDWLADGVTGLLAPEQDTRALGAAIERLLRDRELAERLGRAGFERIRREFAYERYMDAIEGILRVEASGRPTPREDLHAARKLAQEVVSP